MASSALAFSLIVIFWRTRWRWWIIAAGVLYMVTIGFTRLYLGVHYPTDIIGGWVVSMGWVAIVAAVISEYINRRQRLNDAA
jgi:undecaprenyl-diphosphatase